MADISKIPQSQKAWRVARCGLTSRALELAHDAPILITLAEDEVIVKVVAAALNHVWATWIHHLNFLTDARLRGYHFMGLLPNFIARRPYEAAEFDFAGTIVLTNSHPFNPGDDVFGNLYPGLQAMTKQGALAQYIRVPGE
jgi:NADPH:quinone reductase-like Zn-dependent oxidoreductase